MKYNTRILELVTILAILVPSARKLEAFQVLIDVNQLSPEEAGSPGFGQLFSDGVWSVTGNGWSLSQNSVGPPLDDAIWVRVFATLRPLTVVSEDQVPLQPISNTAFTKAAQYTGRVVDAADLYSEGDYPPNDPGYNDLTTNAIQDLHLPDSLANRVVVHNRGYWGPYKTHLQPAIHASSILGVCFEVVADEFQMMTNHIADGINDVLNAGKDCFVLLSPNAQARFPGTYLHKVQSALQYLQGKVNLRSQHLYLVVAAYERQTSGVGFLAGQFFDNSLETAANWLKARPEHMDLYVDRNYAGTIQTGTSSQPFKTLTAAIAVLSNSTPNIFIRAGNYNEHLRIPPKARIQNWGNSGDARIGDP